MGVQNNVKFLMPYKNTNNVVAALREFAQGKRGKNYLKNSVMGLGIVLSDFISYLSTHCFMYCQYLDWSSFIPLLLTSRSFLAYAI